MIIGVAHGRKRNLSIIKVTAKSASIAKKFGIRGQPKIT